MRSSYLKFKELLTMLLICQHFLCLPLLKHTHYYIVKIPKYFKDILLSKEID